MVRLFSEPYETYTEVANSFADRMRSAVEPIIEDAVKDGVCLRDLAYILEAEVSLAISMSVLMRNSKLAIAKKDSE